MSAPSVGLRLIGPDIKSHVLFKFSQLGASKPEDFYILPLRKEILTHGQRRYIYEYSLQNCLQKQKQN